MNEITLSNDLNQIELEINHHKNIAGQSIWEIGRRLNHVKTNNLTHGEFGKWLDKIKIGQREAQRMMKVSLELPNTTTLSHLGVAALNLIASLPEEEREKEHVTSKGETKTPDEMTVRELQELKKQLKEQEESFQRQLKEKDEVINKSYDTIQSLQQQPPKVIEKEVIPDDYEQVKESNDKLATELDKAKYEASTLSQAYETLRSKQQEEEEGSKKYRELTEAIKEMEGKMTRGQKRIQAQKQVYELVDKSKELLIAITPIPYIINAEFVNENEYARKALLDISEQVDKFSKNLSRVLDNQVIIEGEFINE